MKTLSLRGLLPGLARQISRWRRDSSGVAAVEFAMILPLMLVLFLGTVEISTTLAIDRKVSLVAQTVSDLTSRGRVMDSGQLTSFNNIADAMLNPYSQTPLKVTITEI